jgi:hypothetical protein
MMQYPIVCHECSLRVDVTAKPGAELRCPECGGKVEQDWEAKLPTIALGGSCVKLNGDAAELMTVKVPTRDVNRVRNLMGESLGGCIDDKGFVKVRDRDEQQKFLAKKNVLEATGDWHRKPKAAK